MSKAETKKAPGTFARGLSWALAMVTSLLLTAALAGCVLLYAIHSGSLHEKIASDETLLRMETEWAGGKIRELAEEYGFDPSRTLPVLDREMLIRRNLAGITWVAETVTTGKPKLGPRVDDGEIEEMLSGLLRFPNIKDADEAAQAYGDAVAGITGIIGRATFFFRNDLTDLGLAKAREYADVHGFLNLLLKLPVILGVLAGVLAGLMVLLIASRPKEALKYVGSALGGTGLQAAVCLALLRWLDLPGIVAEGNARLAEMLRAAGNHLLLPVILGIAALLILWILCLTIYTRRARRAAKEATAKA